MMNSLLDIMASYRERGMKLDSIVTDDETVVAEWAFLVFCDSKLYFMIRKSDLSKAMKGSLGRIARQMPDLFDVPIVEGKQEVSRIVKGIFVWTRKLEEL